MGQINIIGYGVNVIEHLTLKAIDALDNSDVVLTLANNNEIKILSKFCKSIISIKSLYVDGDKDIDNYYRIYKETVSYLKNYKTISLLVAGHPRFGVTLSQLFEIQASKEGFSLRVIPGVSSFDTMLNDLKVDPLERGSVVIDVNRLLLFEYSLDNKLDYYLYHICSIGNNKTDFINPSEKNNVKVLKEYLAKFYPLTKEILMVQSASTVTENIVIIKSTLGEIENLLKDVNFMSSLFIKGDHKKERCNENFYNTISN